VRRYDVAYTLHTFTVHRRRHRIAERAVTRTTRWDRNRARPSSPRSGRRR
jgi:hypothetical protein